MAHIDPVRRELEELRRTWEEFDALPLPASGDDEELRDIWVGLHEEQAYVASRLYSLLGRVRLLPRDIGYPDKLLARLHALRASRGGEAAARVDAFIDYTKAMAAVLEKARARAKRALKRGQL